MIIRDEMRVERTNIIFGLCGNNTDLRPVRIKLGGGWEGRRFCRAPAALGLDGEVCAGLCRSGQPQRGAARVRDLPFGTGVR